MSCNYVKSLLNCYKEPENYNFEFECDIEEYIELSSIERYIIYRATSVDMTRSVYAEEWKKVGKEFDTKIQKKEYDQLGDCDGASGEGNIKLIYDVYSKLWGWEKCYKTFGNIEESQFKCLFGGETMNSVQTILDAIAKTIISSEKNKFLFDKKRGDYSKRYFVRLYADKECKEELLSVLNAVKGLSEYVEAYHTIGNFCLVPSYFNKCRGFNKTLKTLIKEFNKETSLEDYWDLSLQYLKDKGWKKGDFEEWNDDFDGNFNADGKNIKDYYRYINYFFLWDYVDAYGDAVMLLKREENNLEEKKEFLKKATRFIKRRGCFMVAMLRLQQELGESYNELRNSVFSKDDSVYGSYEDVFKVIIDELDKLLSKTKKQNMRSKLKNLLSEAEEQIALL
jgi:hypothetical protein